MVTGVDYDSLVPVSVKMTVNASRWQETGGWYSDARYAMRVALVSKPTNVVVRQWRVPLESDSGNDELVAEFFDEGIEGRHLGPTVQLEHALVLETPPPNGTRLDAARRGTVLWQARESFQLRGSNGAFPVEAVDFGGSGVLLPKDASWYLDVDLSDLDVPTPNAVRLVLNSANTELMGLMSVTTAGTKLPEEAKSIYGAIRVQLIRRALSCEDLEYFSEYPVGSIGASLIQLCHVDGHDLAHLRGFAKDNPDLFEALMHTVAGRHK
jgi:hypothetical protein